MSERKVVKRDGRVVAFDPSRIERAIMRAMQEERQYDERKLRSVLAGVLKVIDGLHSAGETPSVEEIQDIVEMELVKQDLFAVAKSYIIYRKERERIREEKEGILKKGTLDEVDKSFSVNALRLLAARYLQKDKDGNFIEGPKEMFKRIAALVVIPDVLHDESVFSKSAGQEVHEYERWSPGEWDGKIGLKGADGEYQFTWNRYHLERMRALYDELNDAGKMKKSWSELWDSIVGGEFDRFAHNFNEYYSIMVKRRFLPNSPTLFNAGTLLGQLSACFVLSIEDDIESIMRAATEAAIIFKCLAPGTLVPSSRGVVPIEEIRKGDLVETGRGLSRVLETHHYRGAPVCRLSTKLGLTVAGTPEHGFLVCLEDGDLTWKKMKELQPDDRVLLSRKNINGEALRGMSPPFVVTEHHLLSYATGQEIVQMVKHAPRSRVDPPENDILFDQVVSVEPVGLSDVYDLTVEGAHAYVANGFITHNSGGGIGINYSKLRPAGDMVFTTSGVASGPISFMRIIDTVTDVVRQGGRRRGANMGILNVDHPDVEKFITCKTEVGRFENFNISAMVKESFWECLERGEQLPLVNPRNGQVWDKADPAKLFELIAKQAWKNGDPGVVFFDNVNRRNVMKGTLGPVVSTNPCIVGDSRVSTDRGMIKIADLYVYETPVKVSTDARVGPTPVMIYPYGTKLKGMAHQACGTEPKDIASVVCTGTKLVYEVQTQHGYRIKATSDHKFRTQDGWKPLSELTRKDVLYLQSGAGGFGEFGTLDAGRVVGWTVGDGDISGQRVYLRFYGEDKEVARTIAEAVARLTGSPARVKDNPRRDCLYIVSRRLYRELRPAFPDGNKLQVSELVFRGSKDLQRGFLQGLFTADAHVNITDDKSCCVRLTSISIRLLEQVQLLLLNFGIVSKIHFNGRGERTRLLPDGHGGKKVYECRAYHELSIDGRSRDIFAREIGFLTQKEQDMLSSWIASERRDSDRERYVTGVRRVRRVGYETVFDLKEPETHSFIANGLVIHNCGEEPLYPYESCNLGSINLHAFVKEDPEGKKHFDWDAFRDCVILSTTFLDNVIDVNKFPFDQIERMTKSTRKIGLGIMGLADALFALDIPYNSEQGFEFMDKVGEFLTYWSMWSSTEGSKERGAFPLHSDSAYPRGDLPIEGYYRREDWGLDWDALVTKVKSDGIRNAECTTIAPTGSISMIADTSAGIEPAYALVFEKRVTVGNFLYVDEEFERWLRRAEMYSEKTLKDISDNGGSLQGLEAVPERFKLVFQTALDIPWWDHIRAQAAFAKWIAAAVSKTINMPSWVTVQDVLRAYLFAHKLGVKGITVYRDGSRPGQVLVAPSSKRGGYAVAVRNNTVEMMKKAGIEVEPSTADDSLSSVPPEKRAVQAASGAAVIAASDGNKAEKCPSCGGTRILMEGGCGICIDCGWSHCPVA